MRKTSAIIWQDTQHQALFDILDMLKEPSTTSRVLVKLRDYTENHFALEERYMTILDYPDRETHIRAHNRFRLEILQLLERDDESDEVFREIISTYLTEWLTRHVFGIDKELEAFIMHSKVK